jgi:hypothetical protein
MQIALQAAGSPLDEGGPAQVFGES